MSSPGFVHLRLHTEFSLQDSVIRVPELMQAVASLGMPAVGLSDEHNLFALVKFYRAAMSAGVKPLVGVDFRVRATQEPHAAVPERCRLPQPDPDREPLLSRGPAERRATAGARLARPG
jgi:DNA polymerase-3 subunit alpha